MTPSLADRIALNYLELTLAERRAADTILAHLGDLATYRATELADLASVSKSTMSRLFRRLGYEDFEGVRDQLRELRQSGLPVSVQPASDLDSRLVQERTNLQVLYHSLSEPLLDHVAAALARATRVVVVGQRSSHAAASVLRMNLAQIRTGTLLAPQPGQSLSEDLIGLGPRDVAVVLSFRRHARGIAEVISTLRAQSVAVLLIGDSRLRGLAPRATWWIECPQETGGAFDSHAAAMSLVSLLSDRVLSQVAAGEARIASVDQAYHRLGEVAGG